jgi:hypothetical protein
LVEQVYSRCSVRWAAAGDLEAIAEGKAQLHRGIEAVRAGFFRPITSRLIQGCAALHECISKLNELKALAERDRVCAVTDSQMQVSFCIRQFSGAIF